MPEEICVSFFYISNVIVFFCFIKKLGILMFGNFKNISKIDLLIIDELSYLTFNGYQSGMLVQIISERSERASVIISKNLEFSKWTQLF